MIKMNNQRHRFEVLVFVFVVCTFLLALGSTFRKQFVVISFSDKETHEEYKFTSSMDVVAKYADGRLELSNLYNKEHLIDLRSLSSLSNLTEIYIDFKGNAKIQQLLLPSTISPLRCEIHASSCGTIIGDDLSSTYFFLFTQPEFVVSKNNKIASIVIDNPSSLLFLEKCEYENVIIYSDNNMIPSSSCSITKLNLTGKTWNIDRLNNNHTIVSLSVTGDVIDLTPLQSTNIAELSIFGKTVLSQLIGADKLSHLSLRAYSDDEVDFSSINQIKNLQELTIYVDSSIQTQKYIDHISEEELKSICEYYQQFSDFYEEMREFIRAGGIINVFSVKG